jgi:predicted phage tail protein
MTPTIVLHGELGERFGREYSWDVRDAAEAIRALCCQIKGFHDAFRNGAWQIIRGSFGDGSILDEKSLELARGQKQIHIVPAAMGRKDSGGAIKIVLGVVLIAAAFITGGASLAGSFELLGATIAVSDVALLGAAFAFAGIAQMLSPQPKAEAPQERPDARASFLVNTQVNTEAQGGPIPLIYGEFEVGSHVASVGIHTEDI